MLLAASRVRRRVDDAVPDHLQCCVCLDAPYGRILQCQNGHLLCAEPGPEGGESCSSQVRSSRQLNNCPVCRQTLPEDEIRCLAAEQSISALPAQCLYCMENMTRGDVRRHALACAFAPAKCSAQGCPWSGVKEELDAHQGTCIWAAMQVAVNVRVGPLIEQLKDAQEKIRGLEAVNKELTDHKKELQEEMLMSAAVLGDERMLRTLLRQTGLRPDFALPGTHRQTLLWNAATEGRLHVVEFLLDAGAEVDLTCTETDTTPLYSAAEEGHHKVVKALLDKGANMNHSSSVDKLPVLILAAQRGHHQVVKLLIQHGANVNAMTADEGSTALMQAAGFGHPEIVDVLLAAGADPNVRWALITTDMDYATPLQLAAQDGHLEMVKSLLAKGADVNLMGDNHSSTPLGLAAEFGRLSVAKELLDAGAEVNLASTEIDLPLYLAAYEGHETVVKLLLNAGARLWDDLLVVHQHGRNECNGCDVGIVGDRRFTCTACPDLDLDLEGVSDGRDSYDLCGACHANRIAEEANDAEEESRTHKHRFTEVFHSISLAAVICMRDNLLESA